MFNKHKYSLIAQGPTARDTIFRPLIRQKNGYRTVGAKNFLPAKVKAVVQNEQSMGFLKALGLNCMQDFRLMRAFMQDDNN